MTKITATNIDHKQVWENFIAIHPEANFLSSWNWGQFHQLINHPAIYRGYFQDDQLLGVALFVHETAKRGPHFTIAGGPILDWQNPHLVQAFITDCHQLATKHQAWFVRIRPQILDTKANLDLVHSLGFKSSPMHLAAELTLQLDLNQTLDQILAKMRKNTRYEVKKAAKLGIDISTSTDPDQIKQFHHHQLQLAKRHDFVPFGYDFLHQQFQVFAKDNQVQLIHARHQGKLLATAFVIFYNQEAVYHYGISTPHNHRLPGAYACQWAAIQEAKRRGLSRYNLWGIAPENQTNHRFASLSVFKRGFGGQEVAYLPAHDLPLHPLYRLTRVFESLRAKRRHL